MAYFLPFRPWVAPDPKVFGFLPPCAQCKLDTDSPLMHLDATVASSLFLSAFVLTSHVDRDPFFESTSLKLHGPTAFADQGTLFCAEPCDPAFERFCPSRPKVPSTGFGYPLDGISSSNLGSVFQPPTLMGFTLQSLQLLSSDRVIVSDDTLRSRASLHNLRGLASAPQRLTPTGKAVPLNCHPEG